MNSETPFKVFVSVTVFVIVSLLLKPLTVEGEGSSSTTANLVNNYKPITSYSEYDITRYATADHHEREIKKILRKMPTMANEEDADRYIQSKARGSKVTGKMVISAANKHRVDHHMMLAIMQLDSHFGTRGKGARNKNPGNVGTYGRKERVYNTWEDGVRAVAKWLSKHKKASATR